MLWLQFSELTQCCGMYSAENIWLTCFLADPEPYTVPAVKVICANLKQAAFSYVITSGTLYRWDKCHGLRMPDTSCKHPIWNDWVQILCLLSYRERHTTHITFPKVVSGTTEWPSINWVVISATTAFSIQITDTLVCARAHSTLIAKGIVNN